MTDRQVLGLVVWTRSNRSAIQPLALSSADESSWEVDLTENKKVKNYFRNGGLVSNLLTVTNADGGVESLSANLIVREIRELCEGATESLQPGLAHSLAETGYFPMYGMPTRVRNLYLGSKRVTTIEGARADQSKREWSTIDRDIDLGIYEHAPGAIVVKDKQRHLCVGFTGSLQRDFRHGNRRSPVQITPLDDPLGNEFYMSSCRRCGAWRRFNTPVADEEAACLCGQPFSTESTFLCRTPNGFRTDFNPRSIDEPQQLSGRYRSICAEALPVDLSRSTSSNLRASVQHQSRTYRLNRGARDTEFPMGRGFQVTAGEWRLGQFTTLEGQLIANGPDGGSLLDEDTRNRFSSNNESLPNFWIAAPKTTDSLFIAPSEAHPGLQIHRVGAPALSDDNTGDVVTAVRAAALSATTLIVNRAAIHLDIDPEEFDIIEPRVLTMNGQDVPLLQITDHLVNGVGFCDRLGRPFAGAEQPLIEELIRSMVTDEESYPLEDCMAHRNECDQACYQCLHRYSNQMYHGLLDWRLGLCYLKCLIDQNFDCGLESSRFDEAFQSDWRELAMRLARMFVTRFGGNPTVDLRQDLRLPAFRIPSTRDRWCVVCHPLWIPNPDSGLIAETIGRLGVPADQVSLTDSFELGRRQVTEYQRLRPEGT